MSNNRWDGSLNGINYRLVRGGEAYNRFFSRQTIEENLLSVGSGMTSRTDQRKFYQTDWSGGANWSRPLLTPETANTYQFSRGLTPSRVPGQLHPLNKVNFYDDNASQGMQVRSPKTVAPPHAGGGTSTIYGVSTSNNGTDYYLRYWDNTANSWTNSTGTIGSDAAKWQLIYHEVDGQFYALDDGFISWTDGTTSTDDDAIAVTPSYGASLLPSLRGQGGDPFFYDGSVLYRIDEVGKTLTVVTDDGMGYDVLANIAAPGGSSPLHGKHLRLAISTAEGIYYVKNVWSSGSPQAWLFRVERDSAGNTISVPMATLPIGHLVLSLGYTHGNPVMISTTQWASALQNAEDYPTAMWSVFGGTLGLLGTFDFRWPDDHSITEPYDTVTTIIGHWENMLVIGSQFGIWGYDPVRGGVHFLLETFPDDQEFFVGLWVDQYRTLFQNGYQVDFRSNTDLIGAGTSPPYDDTYSYVLWSNWFDLGLPGEEKTITKIRTQHTDYVNLATHYWTVEIYDDDRDVTGYSTDPVAKHNHLASSAQSQPWYESTGWNSTSTRFIYKLTFESHNSSATSLPAGLIGLWITAETGDPVQGWQLRIDGTVFENVEGIRQNPQDVYDSWVTLGQNMTPITLVDGFEGYDRSESSSHRVRIQSVSISKGDPNESYVDVTLVEA